MRVGWRNFHDTGREFSCHFRTFFVNFPCFFSLVMGTVCIHGGFVCWIPVIYQDCYLLLFWTFWSIGLSKLILLLNMSVGIAWYVFLALISFIGRFPLFIWFCVVSRLGYVTIIMLKLKLKWVMRLTLKFGSKNAFFINKIMTGQLISLRNMHIIRSLL